MTRANKIMNDWGDFTMTYNMGLVPEQEYQQRNQQFADAYAAYEAEIRERNRRMRPSTPEQ